MAKKTTRKRAVNSDDKNQKRKLILDVTLSILDKKDFGLITMNEVAEKAGVAKGTLYLYFKTKEELCLAAYIMDIEKGTNLSVDFLESKKVVTPLEYVDFLTTIFNDNKRIYSLTAAMPVILEKNVSKKVIEEYKEATYCNVSRLIGAMLKSKLLSSPEKASVFMLQFGALIRGLWMYESSSPTVTGTGIADFSEILRYSLLQLLTAPDHEAPPKLK